jgi:uncharacterized protein YyaL (SSP411 family)
MSPYLRQHAGNPVHWREWTEDAKAAARERGTPILLSIGYSACHWCHVMEAECFENPEIAAQMNADFICIKVDREERPDLDSVYMTALQQMTGQGGWPMTMFLTPEGLPFYGGTYFPPIETGRIPSFPRVLESVRAAWHDRSDQLVESAQQMQTQIAEALDRPALTFVPFDECTTRAIDGLATEYDSVWGGFGGAPKFPPAMTLTFLLQHAHRTGHRRAHDMALETLTYMAAGGMYDQLEGGFHRYSVDARWEVPHFEKMLYDNGLLLQSYAIAFGMTRHRRIATVCAQTAEWLINEMQHPEGGFYSALDADSDGREGTYYVWSKEEFEGLFGSDSVELLRHFRCDGPPTFESEYVLQHEISRAELGQVRDTVPHPNNFEHYIEQLRAIRRTRTRPFCDRKIIPSWNGLAISGLAVAGMMFNRTQWIDAAQRAYTFIHTHMTVDGALRRVWLDGTCGAGLAFLDDYANLAVAALDLHRATGIRMYLDDAEQYVTYILRAFRDGEAMTLYDTSHLHEQLVVRPRERSDNALPSGTASTSQALLRLGALLQNDYYVYCAEQLLRPYTQTIPRWPAGFGGILQAIEMYTSPVIVCVVAGTPGALTQYVRGSLPRNAAIVTTAAHPELSLCLHKTAVQGKETLYICLDSTCTAPLTTLREVDAFLQSLTKSHLA